MTIIVCSLVVFVDFCCRSCSLFSKTVRTQEAMLSMCSKFDQNLKFGANWRAPERILINNLSINKAGDTTQIVLEVVKTMYSDH